MPDVQPGNTAEWDWWRNAFQFSTNSPFGSVEFCTVTYVAYSCQHNIKLYNYTDVQSHNLPNSCPFSDECSSFYIAALHCIFQNLFLLNTFKVINHLWRTEIFILNGWIFCWLESSARGTHGIGDGNKIRCEILPLNSPKLPIIL